MKEAHIMADVAISKQRRTHALDVNDAKDFEYFVSIVDAINRAYDQGYTELAISNLDHIVRLTIKRVDRVPP